MMPRLGNQTNVEGTLKKGTDQLTSYNYWLSSGTALGLYRDGDFIPNDTDIDIGISVTEGETPILPILEGFELVRDCYHGGKPMQLAFRDTENGVIFDIYFFYDIGMSASYYNFCEIGEWFYPKMEIKELETKYGSYPFPSPIETYMERRYGSTWKTPSNKKGLYGNDF